MKSIETNGKTVEDAIKAGLKEFNCDLADVTIDVLDSGSPGLFGMFGRLAKVRLTMKEEEALDIEMPVFSLDAQERAPRPEKAKPRPEPERPKSEPKPQAPGKTKPKIAPQASAEPAPDNTATRPAESREREPQPPRPPKQPNPPKAHDPAPIAVSLEDLPPLDMDKLTEVGKAVHAFLSGVTRMMGVGVEIRIVESEDHLNVQMIGDSLGVLIGRRGDTLDALQYLTSLQVNKNRDQYVRVTLDTEHYRAKRVEALSKLANRMATRVRKTGHRVALEPMNPYERRILHSALQGNPYVTTHSEGEEPYRRVIITLK